MTFLYDIKKQKPQEQLIFPYQVPILHKDQQQGCSIINPENIDHYELDNEQQVFYIQFIFLNILYYFILILNW